MITDKKAIECVETLIAFCQEQCGCQNCVFRKFGCDRWECHIEEIKQNMDAKRKNRGWLG